MVVVSLVIVSWVLGVGYESFGRKGPVLIAFAMVIFGWFMMPFVHSVTGYYVATILLLCLPVLTFNPFVPDLIVESSHGLANALRGVCIGIATVVVEFMFMLYKTKKHCFNQNVMFVLIGFLMLGCFLFLRIAMRNIKSANNTPKFVASQALKLFFTEPLILLANLGSIIQVAILLAGQFVVIFVLSSPLPGHCAGDPKCLKKEKASSKEFGFLIK